MAVSGTEAIYAQKLQREDQGTWICICYII
jgi:hypothetical protein